MFRQRIEAEDGQNVDVLVVYHETDVAETTSGFECVLGDLPPEDEVDEDLGDFLERFQINIFSPQAGNDNRVQAFLVEDLLQVLLVLTQETEALAA